MNKLFVHKELSIMHLKDHNFQFKVEEKKPWKMLSFFEILNVNRFE